MKLSILILLMGVFLLQGELFARDHFTMYKLPNKIRNVNCDVYTKLDLDIYGGGSINNGQIKEEKTIALAQLSDHVSGLCNISVPVNSRSYALELDKTECGSLHFKANSMNNHIPSDFTLVDNRNRTCDDLMLGRVVVTENTVNGPITLYSYDR